MLDAKRIDPKKLLYLALIGFFIFPIGDMAHVASGVLSYPRDYGLYIFGIAWWVPFLFMASFVNAGMTAPWLFKIPPATLKSAIWPFIISLGVYFLSSILHYFMPEHHGGLNDVILAVFGIGTWYLFDRSAKGVLFAVVAAVCGVATEMLLVHLTIFFYNPPLSQFNGVPTWLCWLYVPIAIFVKNFLGWQNARKQSL